MKKHTLLKVLMVALCMPALHAYAQRKGTKTGTGINQSTATPGKVQQGGVTTTGSAGAVLLSSAGNTATVASALKRKPIETFIAHVKSTNKFVPITNIWTPDNQYDQKALLQNVEAVQPLTIDYSAVADLIRQNHTAITLVIPGAGGTTYTVELAQYNCLANDFKLVTHNGRTEDKAVAYTPGKYYSGVVKDVAGSVAAFSFFNGEVHGVLSMPGVGNIVVTPNTIAGTSYGYNTRYVLYNDKDLKNLKLNGCGTDGLHRPQGLDFASKTTTTLNNNIYNNCKQIRLMSVADFALYTSQGSNTTNVGNYLTSIFNNMAVLYRNEGVLVEFKALQVNTATDEYAGLANSSILFLKMLGGVVQNNYKTTYGCDVAQLFSTKYASIGGVAWLPGLCLSYDASDSSGSYAFSGLSGSTSTFPTYSWNVEVSTHELGHVLGSWHTHACVWGPARTTAIDGCYTIEGGCANPGNPSGAVGGTIMSYCHLVGGVGINFSNGFGQQPGDTIRYRIGIQGASCGAQYNPSVALPIASRTVTANRECKDLTSGRTYYWYDANTASENDDTLVLIINKGTNSIGDLNSGLTITANTLAGWGGGTGLTTTFPSGISGVLSNNISMRRYWNISGATTPASAVEVLYPFLGTDTADIKGSVASSAMPNYKLYKVNSPISPNPAAGFSGAVAGDFSIYTNAGSPSTTNWALTNIGNTLLARMNMTNLNGGGTAFYTFNGDITGTTTVCVNATTQLSAGSPGGTWTSGTTTVATVDGSGLVTGVAAGTATISYNIGGTPSTAVVTVIGAPGTFGGLTTVCVGSSIVVSNSVSGGTWSSQNTTVATVNSATRTVFGVGGGVTNIIYSTGCGTDGTLAITVTPAPGTIQGPSAVCVGSMIFMSNAVTGGAWSATTTHVSVSPTSGDVLGLTAGTTVIKYSTGCGTDASKTLTVNAAPGAIGGLTTVCQGSTITLSNSVGGGLWTSSNTTVATVNSATRVVTGVGAGTTNIVYSTGCGSDASLAVTVNPSPGTIQGPSTVCVGSMIFMSNAVTGGAWSATTTHVSVSPTSGDVLGLTAGTTVIKYSTGCGTDASKTVTVNAAPGSIGGLTTVCQGSTITLSNSVGGGLWTSSNTTVATVNSAARVVTGVGAGTTNIVYSTGCGSDASLAVTVNPSPGTIQGASSVCVSSTITMSNAVTGGTWSSTTTNVTISPLGVVTGQTAGTTVIKYSTGCGTDASKTVTVNTAPGSIGGLTTVCQGSTITLSNSVGGGLWTSSNTGVATVNSATRVVTGVGAGTTNIVYSTGCGSNASLAVTVNPAPGTIQGPSTVCVGSMIFMSNAVTGGAWSATTTHVSVSPTSGDVLGLTAGTTIIRYSTGCGTDASKTITVKAAPGAIAGANEVCTGLSITLSNPVAGGTWSTSGGFATVGLNTGVVTGVNPGSATIVYSTGCGSNATYVVTVNPTPSAITGTLSVLAGNTTTLSSTTAGGVWSSVNMARATVDPSTGVVSGLTTGTTVISYTNLSGCAAVATLTVTSSFVDGYSVCVGQTVTMNDGGNPGGTWTSGNGSLATIGLTSGIATGVGAGTVIMYYTYPSGMLTATLTVNPLSGTTGLTSVCAGQTITLTNATPGGGVWSSDDAAVATVDASGVVTGTGPGNAVITFTSTAGCATTYVVAVSGGGSITGPTDVCTGQSVALSNSEGGGAWSSSNGSLATVSASGVVTGVAAGAVRISYILGTGCQTVATITVNQLYSVMGNSSMCQGSTIALSNSTPGGGVWSSDNTAAAIINGSGVVTGVDAGMAVISFTANTGGCVATRTITVSNSGTISGPASVCIGQTIALSNSLGGGAWSSSSGSQATVSGAGVVSGVAAGTVRISYVVGSCQSVATVTVNTLQPITGGLSTICQGSSMTLANTTSGGGVWSSPNPAIAVVNSSGVVTGTGGGVATISFTANNSCVATRTVSVTAAPTVSGNMAVCTGQTTQLSNGGVAGAWSSSSAALATVTSGGLVTGVGAGTVRITYMGTTGCMGVATVTVSALSQTTGLSSVCQGQSITLANATPGGGVWSSGNNAVATVSGNVVTGASVGTVSILFTATLGGCVATKTVTVIGSGTISGNLGVCVGQSTPLSVSTGGGNWSTSSGALATISAAGVLWGVSSGTPRVSYIWPTGCQAVATVTVRALMQTTGGTSGMCASGSMLFTNLTPGGGVWTTSNTTIATVNATGTVKGVSPGVVQIFFTAGTACVATRTVIVNACRESGGSGFTTVGTMDVVTDVQLFPNPNNGVFTLTGIISNETTEQADIEIINAVGQIVYRSSAKVQSGKLNEHVDIGSHAAVGNYLLRVRTDQGSNVFRFVIAQ